MRSLALVFFSMLAVAAPIQASGQSTSQTTRREAYVCPKCGKTHYRLVSVSQPEVATVSATSSMASSEPAPVQKSPELVQSNQSVQSTTATLASGSTPVAASSSIRSSGGVINVLANLNAQRRRRGVPILRFDPQLQAVAQRRAQQMASRGSKNHPPGSFAPGRYEGVGWSSSYSPAGVSACYTSDSRMRYAGAAMATGRDGVYFTVVYR